jgi:hypothetical protein
VERQAEQAALVEGVRAEHPERHEPSADVEEERPLRQVRHRVVAVQIDGPDLPGLVDHEQIAR